MPCSRKGSRSDDCFERREEEVGLSWASYYRARAKG